VVIKVLVVMEEVKLVKALKIVLFLLVFKEQKKLLNKYFQVAVVDQKQEQDQQGQQAEQPEKLHQQFHKLQTLD